MTLDTLLKTLFPGKDRAWRTLIDATGIPRLHDYHEEGTFPELIEMLNACFQKLWLRPSGKERWQVKDDHLSDQQKNDIALALQEVGIYKAILPTRKKYDGVILLDAWENSMRIRLSTLMRYWHEGVRFKRLYVMTVDRPLDIAHEPIAHILVAKGLPADEVDMMRYLIAEALQVPGMFAGVDIVYVHAMPQFAATRATTSDNFISWEAQYGVGRPASFDDHRLLIVTNQPYVAYQGAVGAQYLSNDDDTVSQEIQGKETHFNIFGKYEIEAVGEATDVLLYTVGLDTLARFFYASRGRWKANY